MVSIFLGTSQSRPHLDLRKVVHKSTSPSQLSTQNTHVQDVKKTFKTGLFIEHEWSKALFSKMKFGLLVDPSFNFMVKLKM